MIHIAPWLLSVNPDQFRSPSAATAFRYGGRRIGVQRREAKTDRLENAWYYLLRDIGELRFRIS